MSTDAAGDQPPAIPHDTLALRLYLARFKPTGAVTMREAAERVGISHTTWQNWERGRSEPRFSQLQQIALALGVDPRWLIEGGPLPRLDSNQKPAVLRSSSRHLRLVKPPLAVATVVPRDSFATSS